MKLISINVGLPKEIRVRTALAARENGDNGTHVSTGIFKYPVSGPVHVARLNLDGDRQADLTVHGGPQKAVYAYPSEHYAYWRKQLPGEDLPWGAFGENLTTEGLHEDAVSIGDRLRIGTVELVVTQPRLPCYKLGIRFSRPEMVKRFLDSRRTGLYFSVAREGTLSAGDEIELLASAPASLTVADITRLYVSENDDRPVRAPLGARGENVKTLLERAAHLAALPEQWRAYFQDRLDQA